MEVSRDDCSKLIWGEVKLGLDPADLTLLDLGAGTGLVGGACPQARGPVDYELLIAAHV
jgi:hypothetical protein